MLPETEVVAVGPDDAELLRTSLGPGEYVIGRDEGCALCVRANLVSRRHARLTIQDDGVLLEDLGSSHGTFINGRRVSGVERLWPNQKIQIGAATLTLRRQRVGAEDQPPGLAAVRRVLPEEILRERKYQIGKEVAQGGMGAVLSVQEAGIRREVAMKVMLGTREEDDLLRFVEEAQITGQLEHPNIVPVHELGVDEHGQPFYTMKMVRGITLLRALELVKQGKPEGRAYSLSVLLTVFQKVCDALAFAHARGFIHRDLKPENVMLGDYGEVLVMDWGLAKRVSAGEMEGGWRADAAGGRATGGGNDASAMAPETPPTVAGTVMGTPQYMSPEQARGEVETLDARSDLYALGAVLYQILALRPPITGRNAEEIVDRVTKGRIAPLVPMPLGAARAREYLPGGEIPDSLAAVVRKAMAFAAGDRYASVVELQAEIAAYQSGFATAAEEAGLWKQFTLLVARNQRAAAITAVALIALASFGITYTVHIDRERERAEVQKQRAVVGEKQAEQSLAVAKTTLLRVKIDKAREAFDNHRADEGLAWLAAVLRQDPQSRFAPSWILSALTDRNFPLPSAPRIIVDKAVVAGEGAPLVRFSPKGAHVFFNSEGQRYGLWEVATGRVLWTREGDARRARFSPDGRQIAVNEFGAEEKTIRFLEAATGRVLEPSIVHDNNIKAFDFSPDGTLIVLGDRSGGVRVWDARSGQPQGAQLQAAGFVTSVGLSADNRWLAALSVGANQVQVWDRRSGALLPALPAGGDYYGAPSFHPATGRLLIPHGPGAHRPWIFDPAEGRIVEAEERHAAGPYMEGCFSPDGARIVSGSTDYRARIWDARTGAPLGPWLRHGGPVVTTQFSPEGLRLFTAATDGVGRLWDVRTGEALAEPLRLTDTPLVASQSKLSPDGIHVATPARRRGLQLWDIREGRQLPRFIHQAGVIQHLAQSADGRLLATSSDNPGQQAVRLWDAATGAAIGPEIRHDRAVRGLAFSPDGRRLATGCFDGHARMWDTATGALVGPPMPHGSALVSLAFSDDGRVLASGSTDKTVRLWDAGTGQPVGEPFKMPGNPQALAFSPDGTLLATATDSGATLDEIGTGHRRTTVGGGRCSDVRFNAGGTRLAVATEQEGVRVVDPANGRDAFPALPVVSAVRAVRFSADGGRLLSAALDGTARVWDAHTGVALTMPMVHANALSAAAFSPDGERCAIGAVDGSVRIWDARAGQPLSEPLRHADEIRTLHFSPDGQRLAVATAGTLAVLWDVPPAPPDPPAWLASLAEVVAGRSVNAGGELTPTAEDGLWNLRRQLLAPAGHDFYARWAAWFLGDRTRRMSTPWSGLPIGEACENLLALDAESVREQVLRRLPQNAAAVSRQARDYWIRSKTVPALERDAELLLTAGARLWVEQELSTRQDSATTPGPGPRGFSGRDPAATARELDLTWHYTATLESRWAGDDPNLSLAMLPKGLQVLDGIRFDVRGLIALFSEKLPAAQAQPGRVEGIPVGQRVTRFQVLQASAHPAADGQRLATYVVHYADGQTQELPVIAGEDLRTWVCKQDQKHPAMAREAWRDPQGYVRLFHRAYENPRPAVEVTRLDFLSTRAVAAPFVVAISVE